MRIKLLGHCRDRMSERDVTIEDIERALRGYSMSESQKLPADPGKSRIVGPSTRDGERLMVVVLGELPPLRLAKVVTVYWERKGDES